MEKEVKVLISGDITEVPDALAAFIELATPMFKFPDLDQKDYRRNLWKSLHKFITSSEYASVHCSSLTAIRLLSREKKDLHDVINKEVMGRICYHAGLLEKQINCDNNANITVEALKCLINLIFNCPVAACICSTNGTINGIIERFLATGCDAVIQETILFDLKVLFIISAVRPEVRSNLKDDVLDILTRFLSNLTNTFKQNQIPFTDIQVDIICEILKVLFNITIPTKHKIQELDLPSTLVAALRDVLLIRTETDNKRMELHNHTINALNNVRLTSYKELFVPQYILSELDNEMQYEGMNMQAVAEILAFLKMRVNLNPTVSDQHEVLSPVLTVLIKCAQGERIMRKYLRREILPPLKDATRRPEDEESIRGGLCKLLTSPITQVKSFVAELLFILCKENLNRMIKYTGYGNAAGLFASRGLLGRDTNNDVSGYSSESSDSDTDEYKELKSGINPVVGCYEAPRPKPTDNMSEEQKEYEAMQLVQLINKLAAQGIVQPCRVGADGTPKPVEHIMQLTENVYTGEEDD